MPLKGLIFDFDGLIIDTESPEYDAWQEIYHENGAHLDVVIWSRVIGSSNEKFDPVQHLEILTGKTFSRQQLISRHRARSDELAANLPMLPGVKTLLENARSAGLKLAIASSSDRFWVESHLVPLGIKTYFDFIVTKSEIRNVKPLPDLYQAAMRGLQILPSEGIAFEDSPNGITAARSAGLFCVAVPNPITAQLSVEHANITIPSLLQASIQQLQIWANHHPTPGID